MPENVNDPSWTERYVDAMGALLVAVAPLAFGAAISGLQPAPPPTAL